MKIALLFVAINSAFALAASTTASAADRPAIVVPAGAVVRFHVNSTLSSNDSKTGDHFSFTTLAPITVDSNVVVASGAEGTGTLVLAGRAGGKGHEGNLTLRLDSVRAVDGRELVFNDQQLELNGTNHKGTSNTLQFVPFVGTGARFIRGEDIQVNPDRAIETVLKNAATTSPASDATPSPSPTHQ